MTYLVIVTQMAKEDLRHDYAVAADHGPRIAWLNQFEEALQTPDKSQALSTTAGE